MTGPNFLERFRPVGAPGGGASGSGRATDTLGPEVELAPVLAALERTFDECRAFVEESEAAARRTLVEARARAAAVVAEARMETAREQADAAARVLARATAADDRVIESAHRAAARVKESAAGRVEPLAHDVVERMVAQVLGRGEGSGALP
ncbi:MAG TPA: hypothetical protein VFC82_11005 [Actinomycetaceae bacterium]|nr:hypothetical protein [Actinomycetaceae bacterium]